ncbi:MAG: hypothetical protein MJ252_31110 [archaeon]|nr:hypothetical protein [archaeon]
MIPERNETEERKNRNEREGLRDSKNRKTDVDDISSSGDEKKVDRPMWNAASIPILISAALLLVVTILASIAFGRFSDEKRRIQKYLDSNSNISQCNNSTMFYDPINCIRHFLYPELRCYSNRLRTKQVSCSGRHAKYYRNTYDGIFKEELAHCIVVGLLFAFEGFQVFHTMIDIERPGFPTWAVLFLLIKVGIWIWGTVLGYTKVIKTFDVEHYNWRTDVKDSFHKYYNSKLEDVVKLTKAWVCVFAASTLFTFIYLALIFILKKK